jgi:hypothetical protein
VYGCRSRGTLAAPTIVQNNDVLATYLGLGFDGTDLAIAADIEFQVDGTPGSDDMPGRILFKTTPDGTQTPVEAMRIDSAQNVTLATGNLVIGTSGKGIDFSATAGTGTSELFDDYEEGTWTPVFTTSGTGFDVLTMGTTIAFYTKIGRTVYVNCYADISACTKGAASGSIRLGGLPFTSANTYPQFTGACISYLWAGDRPSIAAVLGNSTQIMFNYYSATNADAVDIDVADFGTSSGANQVRFSVMYQAL